MNSRDVGRNDIISTARIRRFVDLLSDWLYSQLHNAWFDNDKSLREQLREQVPIPKLLCSDWPHSTV
jgi:hypothetical protein